MDAVTRKKSSGIAACAAALLACAGPAGAQIRPAAFSVGARVLGALPISSRSEILRKATGFGVDLGVEVLPGWSVYAGFSRTAFPLENRAGEWRVDSGADVGVTTEAVVGGLPLWARYGLVFHEAETHLGSARGDGEDDGKTGMGLETAFGVLFASGPHLAVRPGVAYTAYPLGEAGGVSHVRAELGVRIRP